MKERKEMKDGRNIAYTEEIEKHRGGEGKKGKK